MSNNIDIKLQIESINVAMKELKKHFGELYELGALSNSIPLLEELEKLREGRKEIPIATITINNEALQKMVDEKVKEIEFDIQEIRNKAIDDFTEQLKNSLIHNYKHFLTRDTDGFDWLTTDAVNTHIDEVAEQLKEGRECRQ